MGVWISYLNPFTWVLRSDEGQPLLGPTAGVVDNQPLCPPTSNPELPKPSTEHNAFLPIEHHAPSTTQPNTTPLIPHASSLAPGVGGHTLDEQNLAQLEPADHEVPPRSDMAQRTSNASELVHARLTESSQPELQLARSDTQMAEISTQIHQLSVDSQGAVRELRSEVKKNRGELVQALGEFRAIGEEMEETSQLGTFHCRQYPNAASIS